MSTDLNTWLIQECKKAGEPYVPLVNEPSWFSIDWVGEQMGYDSRENFRRKVNAANIPRHPLQKSCIQFESLDKLHVQPDQTQQDMEDSI